MKDTQQSIIELAECIKELVRLLKSPCTEEIMQARLDKVYSKAILAKDRMPSDIFAEKKKGKK